MYSLQPNIVCVGGGGIFNVHDRNTFIYKAGKDVKPYDQKRHCG